MFSQRKTQKKKGAKQHEKLMSCDHQYVHAHVVEQLFQKKKYPSNIYFKLIKTT